MSLYDDSVGALDASFSVDAQSARIPGREVGGLGSLADELAGAFGEYDEDEDEDEDEEDGDEGGDSRYFDEEIPMGSDEGDDSLITSETTPVTTTTNGTSSPSKDKPRSISGLVLGRRPPNASDYDGSDYGDPDDLVETGISFGLEDKLWQIERLTLRNRVLLKGNVGGGGGGGGGGGIGGVEDDEADAGVVGRLLEGLQQLLPQSQLEAGCARLITAHSALSSHMLHQTRTLRELLFAATSSSSLPAADTTELLLSLIELIPRPTIQPLAELNALHNVTVSLISQLAFLSDSLHMARQSSVAATRKLRVAREACADWRTELETVEKAKRWIENGDWDGKCRRREAAVVCKDVTSGFEDVCRGFEEKLKAQQAALVTA
jgi:hypothetical protein